MRRGIVNSIVAVAVLAITIVPIGAAVFVLGFAHGDSPCVMCWEQRIGMALLALAGLFVLRYGPKPRYVGVALFVAAWGLHMAMRHLGMHAARDVGQGFSAMILGAHTYTWSLFIFWAAIATLSLLLLASRDGDVPPVPRSLGPLGSLAAIVFLVVVAGNIVQAFCSTGPPPYMGQSDPVRFSFNPTHWVWSTEELTSRVTPSWRGRWAIDAPDVARAAAVPAGNPFAMLPAATVCGRRRIMVPLRGTVTDLAYDPASTRFLLTTEAGVYILDDALDRIVRYTLVDPGYSVDLGRFAGAAFLDSHTVIAVGENKSYVVLNENDRADGPKNFRYFLESPDRFDERARGRFSTVRARMNYTMSAAYDPSRNAVYSVSVPNSKAHRLVVSRFDAGDMTLSEEFVPKPGSGVTLGPGGSLDRLYVTGAAIDGERLWAMSAAGNVLFSIDLESHEIDSAYLVSGLERPTGVAVHGDELYISGERGEITIVTRPGLSAERTRRPARPPAGLADATAAPLR